jgi:diguanylate cyclase (GGDEF)-like protein
VLATLLWTPPAVGSDLLKKSLPTVLALILCLCAVASYLFQNARRAARNLVASEARNAHLATHDVLTGLANRALLYDRLGHALERLRRTGETFAVHWIDLDRFKEINDTFGHEAGDDLLRAAAQMLRSHCSLSGMLARLGGDEFVIVQEDTCENSASHFADNIVRVFCEPIDLAVGRVHIGCSIGTSFIRNCAIDPPSASGRPISPSIRRRRRAAGAWCCSRPRWTRPCAAGKACRRICARPCRPTTSGSPISRRSTASAMWSASRRWSVGHMPSVARSPLRSSCRSPRRAG